MPHFYVFNTYGFGNESNQQNQNTNMSQDTNASNASSQNTGSSATFALANGLRVSNRKNLRKRQLKAFHALCTRTLLSGCDKPSQVCTWNNWSDEVRNHPELVMLAMKSAPYYFQQSHVNLTSDNVKTRTEAYLLAKSITLSSTDGMVHCDLFTHQCRNFAYLHAHHKYDYFDFMHYIGNRKVNGETVDFSSVADALKCTDVIKAKNDIQAVWDVIRHIPTQLNRIAQHRIGARNDALLNARPVVSLRERMRQEYERIYQTRPIHWAGSLTPQQHRMATRVRPDGECVGIELEFVASSNGDICNWDEDAYPFQTWHTFKTDGSINTQNSDERIVRYQEYTCFINANNPTDWSNVRSVMRNMTNGGAIVNNSCGNHVHIDMRHKSQASYYRIASKVREAFQNWAHRLVSYKRAYGRYCGIQNDHQNNRYTAINTACWNEHRTLEVRIGMPTLNYQKLYHWTQFLRYLCENYTRIDTFEGFMNSNAPLQMKLYVLKRIGKFERTYIDNGKQVLQDFDKYSTALNDINACDTEFVSQNYTGNI